jgi:splicing factor 3A subunit 3
MSGLPERQESVQQQQGGEGKEEILNQSSNEDYLIKAARLLETNRSLITEHEASLCLASSLLSNPLGLPQKDQQLNSDAVENEGNNSDFLPDGVKDGWLVISEMASSYDDFITIPLSNSNTKDQQSFEYPLNSGQLSKAIQTSSLSILLNRASTIAQEIFAKQRDDSRIFVDALKDVKSLDFQKIFADKVAEIQEYHARHNTVNQMIGGSVDNEIQDVNQPKKKRKLQNPIADGYDLYSILHPELNKIANGILFSVEEVFGKYLDLYSSYELFLLIGFTDNTATATDEKNNKQEEKKETESVSQHLSYVDFLLLIQNGLHNVTSESSKLFHRKRYMRFLQSMYDYLVSFLNRTVPLLDVKKEVIEQAHTLFNEEWSREGGVIGWEHKALERVLVPTTVPDPTNISSTEVVGSSSLDCIDLEKFRSVKQLIDDVPAEALKVELARLGMKCGGTVLDQAKRLWSTKGLKWEDLPRKLFVKGIKSPVRPNLISTSSSTQIDQACIQINQERRVDIARLEYIVTALLDQVRPSLDATTRRAERRLTQTVTEKEREVEEEISGAYQDRKNDENKNKETSDSEDSDDEDTPVYNPKGVPLGWDGKPIPYWLFKLHGLNHFFPCEICGNESYRGRYNFEKHFAEAKHSFGMKCLGIPNTKHFHGVTKIEDAQNLWTKLQGDVNKDVFDASKEEEYEDSHGNILSRATYEDLARQGLL